MSFSERLKRLLFGGGPAPASEEGEGESGACRQITCAEALERVHGYLDGELDHVSHQEVAEHFAMCKRCYPHLHLEERFRELLHRSQEGEVSDHVKEQVLEMLAGEVREGG
jgi:anti-sigma factor (TIGR02949 family)